MKISNNTRTEFAVRVTPDDGPDLTVYGCAFVQVTGTGINGRIVDFAFHDTDDARFFADLIQEAADAADQNNKVDYAEV